MDLYTSEVVPKVVEVTLDNFWKLLPEVLLAIAEATFVAIDLEMSGISTKNSARPILKPTLEAAYKMLMDAASTYQILQFGLTCARVQSEDNQDSYVTQTFSFQLSPLFPVSSGWDNAIARRVDRKVSFALGTVSFLENTGFDFSKSYERGIPYLSRLETCVVRNNLTKPYHIMQKNLPRDCTVNPNELGAEAAKFYREFYEKIRAVAQEGVEYINIENPWGGRLNKIQIAILEKIVYVDLADYHLRGRMMMNQFYQVEKADLAREAEDWARSITTREAAINRQTGFRYIFEALATSPGVSNPLDADLYEKTAQGVDANAMRVAKVMIQKAQAALKVKKPILVVHNALADLCFLVSTFIGPLPAELEQFLGSVRMNFARFVDTKYLVSRGHHDMMPEKNLSEMFEEYKNIGGPIIRPAATGEIYGRKPHEAGYDSWMTAVVFVKLCFIQAGNPEVLRHLPREDGPANSIKVRRREAEVFGPTRSGGSSGNSSGNGNGNGNRNGIVIVNGSSNGNSNGNANGSGGAGGGDGAGSDRIPQWNSDLFRFCANRTRVGNSGVLRF